MKENEMEKILMDNLKVFKEKLKEIAEKTVSNVYCDVLPFILSDTQSNATIKANDALKVLLQGRQPENISFPWEYPEVALKLYDANKERIENAIIKAQAEKIISLTESVGWHRSSEMKRCDNDNWKARYEELREKVIDNSDDDLWLKLFNEKEKEGGK